MNDQNGGEGANKNKDQRRLNDTCVRAFFVLTCRKLNDNFVTLLTNADIDSLRCEKHFIIHLSPQKERN